MRRRHPTQAGAELLEDGGAAFRLWAPGAETVGLLIEAAASQKTSRETDGQGVLDMRKQADGWFSLTVPQAAAGTLYRFVLADGMKVPDPASRFQPRDVHGPSEVIDPNAYDWTVDWRGRPWDEVVLYELHVGAFTDEGTFRAAAGKLDHLAALGVTAVEVMPVWDFPGRRNWGYDGVLPYAPDSSYGRPEDFKAFIEAAHRRGIAVLLDVVYNHFGPDGNYLPVYAPQFFTERHHTPWGAAVNYDGPGSQAVREFVINNALYWLEEYDLDGLRLDAVHAIIDDGPKHLLDELSERARALKDRPVHLVLENEDNEPKRLARQDGKPARYTAQWNDDLHHVLHVAATGESSGYYADYTQPGGAGDTGLLATALAEGFAYQGQMMPYRGSERGEPAGFLPPGAFVAFIQNHDQVGNRAFGDRLGQTAKPAAMRALAATYLLLPQTPMLFMGEEWGARQPFPFFCDFDGDLADAVREGRRSEFARFPEFQDPEQRERIPDPLAEATFASAKLDWSAIDQAHLAHYTALLAARREHIAPLLEQITHGGSGPRDRPGRGAGHLVRRRGLHPDPGRQPLRPAGHVSAAGRNPDLVGGRDRHHVAGALVGALVGGAAWCRSMSASTPVATYRLQFHAGFGFKDATRLAPYLAGLGISHVYASSYLKAKPGSTHGYDIIDHLALNPELGTEDDFAAMVAVFRSHGLGQILDFVPNHMGVGGGDNPLWLDVLEWGPQADHAGWFDIDWDPDRRYLKDKLLVPFLGNQYGVELKDGRLQVKFDAEAGSLAVWAYDTHKLPICPLHYDSVLGQDDAALDRLADYFSDLPRWYPQIAVRAAILKAELAACVRDNPASRDALDRSVAALNQDWRALDRLIQLQSWRIADFRVAGDDINYRRFFNINDLAGIRMELPAVFDHAHGRILPMLEDGTLDGLRIDHIDGLLDPKAYIDTLRAAVSRPFYLVVEKILAAHEALREDWQVQGTTGYDFTNLVLGVLINPASEAAFTAAYQDFTGLRDPFASIVYRCKVRIMENEMASELNALGRDAGRVARQSPVTQDFTKTVLQRAIKQIVACFPVYRTYIEFDSDPDAPAASGADRRDLDWAVTQARRFDPDLDPSVFDFLHALLSGRLSSRPQSGFSRSSVLRLAMKLQQYSGPVMAKGLEDTAFYRYNRFVALNEVGGEPDRFGISAGAFHKANAQRARRWPQAMLATSTHDTKRGEDTRARLAALADMPEEWTRQVQGWSRLIRARRGESREGEIEGNAPPDRNDEYLLYQLLVGSWPVDLLEAPDAEGLEAYGKRIAATLEKSMREAKLHSNWSAPDAAYEEAMQSFAKAALDPNRAGFLASFLPFVQRVARLGMQNSLVQAVLKLTVPGMPDIYQGCELWDLSLVDPDNRRPVDYDIRARALDALQAAPAGDLPAMLRDLLAHWSDGRIKLAVVWRLLKLRGTYPALFAEGGYEALGVTGDKASQALGFLRSDAESQVAVLVALYPGLRDADPDWRDSRAALPEGTWRDLFSGAVIEGGRDVALNGLFGMLPAAVLVKD